MQYHLTGKGYSGRAVRCRELSPDEIDANLTNAARLGGKDVTILELKKLEWRNGVKLMVTEFTEPCADPFAADVKWKKATAEVLDDIGKYFKAKDVLALEAIFRQYHEVIPAELDAILGKAIPLSSEG